MVFQTDVPTRPTVRRRITRMVSESDPAATTGKVYLAYPLTIHRTPRVSRLVRFARQRFPHAEVLPACDLYASNADWLHRWPAILSTLVAVCVVTDGRGWVGLGVWTEVLNAQAVGVPVYLLTDETLSPWAAAEVTQLSPDSWRQHARLRVAKPVGQDGDG
ncbi:MAG: hypothetical protein M3Q03_00160 [Chloroflexota bacterium]|nr:hypothetical protein [Chloroflexota bacterium]